jgi:5-methylcytosine-specific restriction endonuclease McrA
MSWEPEWFEGADEAHINRERRKARELRQSQWWKNLRATNRCHYCRQSFSAKELTMDHIVPLARGGQSTKSNIVPCCKSCNTQKKYLLPVEWDEHLQRIRNEKTS